MSNSVITRIVMFLIFPMCIIAMLISLTGFEGPIQFDDSYYNFIQKVSLDLNSWKISIPEIPKIPLTELGGSGGEILNFLINFVNFLVILLNVVITVLNVVIELIQFIVAFIRNIFDFTEQGFADSGELSYWV